MKIVRDALTRQQKNIIYLSTFSQELLVSGQGTIKGYW